MFYFISFFFLILWIIRIFDIPDWVWSQLIRIIGVLLYYQIISLGTLLFTPILLWGWT